jgi:hypothetical protein
VGFRGVKYGAKLVSNVLEMQRFEVAAYWSNKDCEFLMDVDEDLSDDVFSDSTLDAMDIDGGKLYMLIQMIIFPVLVKRR